MTLDLHQRRALAKEIWNARDFVIDCRINLGNAGADEETLRQLAINIAHLAKIAEDLEAFTPEDVKQWGRSAEELRNEEYVKNVWAREEETQAEHDLDVNINRYAGCP